MTDKTSREILDAIDRALKETSARLAARPKPALYPPRILPPDVPARPKTSREILDAIDAAIKETHRRFAERGH